MIRRIIITGMLFVLMTSAMPVFGQNIPQNGGIPLFLPVVMNSYSAPALINGDFEAGHTGWVEYSLNQWDIILEFPTLDPHTGSWAAWLGGDYGEVAYIEQIVKIPLDKPVLSYWYVIASEVSVCNADFARILIDDAQVYEIALCKSNSNPFEIYAQNTLNLSTYKGKQVHLQFRVETGPETFSNWFLDDISFVAP
jgi:hypothetical protein